MNFRRKRREMPGLNTASTADISFMLLIFFLVTTSMEVDKGMPRQLPPYDDQKQEKLQDIDKTKVLSLYLHKDGVLDVQNENVAEGATRTMQLPFGEKDRSDISREFKQFIVSKGPEHIIELRIDRDANYDSYFALQNAIVRSYREIRNAAAEKQFGKPYAQCNEDARQKLLEQYPQRIQEISVVNSE